MSSSEISFPRSVGASTVYEVAQGRLIKIFMLDASVPLFNVIFDGVKFLANREQVIEQIEACQCSGTLVMPPPTWEWKLNTGFEKSVDGHSSKGWVLISQ